MAEYLDYHAYTEYRKRRSQALKKDKITGNMVFYDRSKKRHQRTANTTKSATSIANLPDELLLKVMDNVATGDLLKFRQTSRVLVAASTSLLRSRLKVLYVHPTPTSLRSAIEICHSDLCTEIEEIALLGKVPWYEILKYARDPRLETERARRHGRPAFVDYLPWPAKMPKMKVDISSADSSRDKRLIESDRPELGGRCFAEVYVQLLDALANLPKARKLSFRSSCGSPGFNMVSQSQIESHTTKSCHQAPEHSDLSLTKRDNKSDGMSDTRFSDSDAIFALLDCMPTPFTELVITDEMRYIAEHAKSLSPTKGSFFFTRLRNKVANLTSVEFHVTTGWLFTEWQRTCCAILALAAPQLQSLTLRFQHNAAMRRAQADESLSTVIRGLTFPRLQRLDLAALLPPREDARVWRPVCHNYNFAQFVRNHRGSLSQIRLENVLFGMTCQEATLLEQTRAILAMQKKSQASLIDANWLINRYMRDPRCNKEETATGHNCRHDCYLYSAFSYAPIGISKMCEFAGELGAKFNEEAQVWTFRN